MASSKSPLGNNSKSRKQTNSNNDISACLNRLNNWRLQAVAREILGEKGITSCCRVLLKNTNKVTILESKTKTYSFSGVMRCGSVWRCPICANKITEKKRKDLKKGMDYILNNGAFAMMLTLTVPHYVQNSCLEVTDNISNALRRFYNRETWKGSKNNKGGFVQLLGIIGRIRAFEVTYTRNGWHSHFHTILLTDRKLPAEEYEFTTRDILAHWQSCCVAAGLPKPNEHGVSLCDGSKVANYISKWGIEESSLTQEQRVLSENTNHSWDIESEMVRGHLKKGTNGSHVGGTVSYTPFGILQMVSDTDREVERLYKSGDVKKAALMKKESYKWAKRFREYADCFHGRRQLVYSDGLRFLMGLEQDEKSDEELVYEKENGSRLFATIPEVTWKVILSQEMRGELLEACRYGEDYLEAWILNILEADKLGSNIKEKHMAFRKLQSKNKELKTFASCFAVADEFVGPIQKNMCRSIPSPESLSQIDKLTDDKKSEAAFYHYLRQYGNDIRTLEASRRKDIAKTFVGPKQRYNNAEVDLFVDFNYDVVYGTAYDAVTALIEKRREQKIEAECEMYWSAKLTKN